jgi:dipeptidase E
MHCILASTSTVHGSGYLEYLQPQLEELYDGIDEVLFIPYARPSGISHEQYTQLAQDGLRTINIKLKGIHHFDNPREAVRNAEAFFVGGGNTFLLVKTLQELNLMSLLKDKIIQGAPYLGTSAGTNIAGVNMQTTNDMPIVMPPSFETMGVLPFNINAHYIEPDPKSTHKGETRRTRIKEFQKFNDLNVLGLKEGSWLEVKDHTITLKGDLEAVWFQPGTEPEILQATHVF